MGSTFKKFLAVLPGGILGCASVFDALVGVQSRFPTTEITPGSQASELRAHLVALAIGTVSSRSRRDLICAVFGLLSFIGYAAESSTINDSGDDRSLSTGSELMGYEALGVVFGPLLVSDVFGPLATDADGSASPATVKPGERSQGRSRARSRARSRSRHTPAHTPMPPMTGMSAHRIITANKVAEMVIAHWIDVVRHLRDMGICRASRRRSDIKTVNHPDTTRRLLNSRSTPHLAALARLRRDEVPTVRKVDPDDSSSLREAEKISTTSSSSNSSSSFSFSRSHASRNGASIASVPMGRIRPREGHPIIGELNVPELPVASGTIMTELVIADDQATPFDPLYADDVSVAPPPVPRRNSSRVDNAVAIVSDDGKLHGLSNSDADAHANASTFTYDSASDMYSTGSVIVQEQRPSTDSYVLSLSANSSDVETSQTGRGMGRADDSSSRYDPECDDRSLERQSVSMSVSSLRSDPFGPLPPYEMDRSFGSSVRASEADDDVSLGSARSRANQPVVTEGHRGSRIPLAIQRTPGSRAKTPGPVKEWPLIDESVGHALDRGNNHARLLQPRGVVHAL